MIRLLVVLLLSCASAAAHEWYPPFCCSGNDCEPVVDSRVEAQPEGGYLLDKKFYVPPAAVRKSEDGRFHACFPTPEKLQCFFAPPNAS